MGDSYLNKTQLTNLWAKIKALVEVDSELSASSTNPVQNKVVKAAIEAKPDISITAVRGVLTITKS